MNKTSKKYYNHEFERMVERDKEKRAVKKFNKSPAGKELHRKVAEAKVPKIKIEDVPF